MAEDTLSTEKQYATVQNNTPGTPTPVVEWDVPDGMAIEVRQGQPVILDAETTNGNNPANATRLGLAYREPNDPLDQYTVISDMALSPFNTLSLKDQQSGENAQRRRMQFDPSRVPEGRFVAEDADSLALVVNGPDELDAASLFVNYPIRVQNR
ncbi:hypothetical protein [Halostella salina]|uniref:hypothetical protein n=1 Tax=Halostella salina TaxID=1547897 RepID=UPI000EF793BE|nr:hypothetical protein [Halostella salina]